MAIIDEEEDGRESSLNRVAGREAAAGGAVLSRGVKLKVWTDMGGQRGLACHFV